MNCALLVALPDGWMIPEVAATLRVLLARGLTLLRQRNYEGISSAVSRLWNIEPPAIRPGNGFRKVYRRSHHAVIRVYNDAGNVIETHEHAANALIYHEACFGAMTTILRKQDN